jgi:hypothetical protein
LKGTYDAVVHIINWAIVMALAIITFTYKAMPAICRPKPFHIVKNKTGYTTMAPLPPNLRRQQNKLFQLVSCSMIGDMQIVLLLLMFPAISPAEPEECCCRQPNLPCIKHDG